MFPSVVLSLDLFPASLSPATLPRSLSVPRLSYFLVQEFSPNIGTLPFVSSSTPLFLIPCLCSRPLRTVSDFFSIPPTPFDQHSAPVDPQATVANPPSARRVCFFPPFFRKVNYFASWIPAFPQLPSLSLLFSWVLPSFPRSLSGIIHQFFPFQFPQAPDIFGEVLLGNC